MTNTGRRQRANVEAARASRCESGILTGTKSSSRLAGNQALMHKYALRTLVCYKETEANAVIDPAIPLLDGYWRDGRFSPPADGAARKTH